MMVGHGCVTAGMHMMMPSLGLGSNKDCYNVSKIRNGYPGPVKRITSSLHSPCGHGRLGGVQSTTRRMHRQLHCCVRVELLQSTGSMTSKSLRFCTRGPDKGVMTSIFQGVLTQGSEVMWDWNRARGQQAAWMARSLPKSVDEGGNNGNGSGSGNGNGKGNNDGDDEEGGDDDEFLDLQRAEELAATKGMRIPEDYAAAARDGGLRSSVLNSYLAIASGGTIGSMLARSIPAFRDRLVADRLYFFKILAEVSIDSACATVAEFRKRGDEFWSEFEFYLSDLIVGLVLDVVLVSLLAPVAVPGRSRKMPTSGLRAWSAKLPSAMFAKSESGRKYAFSDRLGCYVARGLEYSLAGMACGFVGQALASGLMIAKRKYLGTTDDDVPVPPVMQTALVWGAFMGLSANTRYQIVFGLERIVDETIAKRIPQIAYLTTTLIRFANNIVGGEQFIDMARWAGVQ